MAAASSPFLGGAISPQVQAAGDEETAVAANAQPVSEPTQLSIETTKDQEDAEGSKATDAPIRTPAIPKSEDPEAEEGAPVGFTLAPEVPVGTSVRTGKRVRVADDDDDDADVEYRLPRCKVLKDKHLGTMTTVPWDKVPCESGDRCWRTIGGHCFFLHDGTVGEVVWGGSKIDCDMYRGVRGMSINPHQTSNRNTTQFELKMDAVPLERSHHTQLDSSPSAAVE